MREAVAVAVRTAFGRPRLKYVFFEVDKLLQCWVLVWAMTASELAGFSQPIHRWFISQG